MRQATVILLAISLVGCDATKNSGNNNGTGGSTTAQIAGSWHATVTSAAGSSSTADTIITQTGTALAAQKVMLGGSCAQTGTMTGKVDGNNITLTITEDDVPSDVVTVTGTFNSGAITGTYTTTGACTSGDHGNIAAQLIPSVASSSWSGSTSSGNGGSGFTANLSEDAQGNISGALSFTSSHCLPQSLAITGSQIGDQISVSDGNGILSATGTVSPGGKSVSGTYQTGSQCSSDAGTFTMSRP